MLKRIFIKAVCIFGLVITTSTLAKDQVSPVHAMPGTDNIPGEYARSVLKRKHKNLVIDVKTDGLDSATPYTMWAVIFNNPKYCKTQPCSPNDLPFSSGHDARVEASLVFAGGGVSGVDGSGHFLGRVFIDRHKIDNQVLVGNGTLTNRHAEVHVVLRSHGMPSPKDLFAALTSFNGGCTETNLCEDQQFSIHKGKIQ